MPGRIEVLGKHTDYAGGRSLLVAVDRGFTFHAEPLAGDQIVIVAEDSGQEARYTIGSDRAIPATGPGRPAWARYADGVLARLAEDGHGDALRGARLSFRSTLPAAAGLSSSSALVTGVFLGLDVACHFSGSPAFRSAVPDREALAAWLAAAEMGGPVGTRGGAEDHTAILCAREGRIVRYEFTPVDAKSSRFRGSTAVPEGWTFAVGASGVTADKGGAAQVHYNRLSDTAAQAARAWAAAGAGSDTPMSGTPMSDTRLTLGDALVAAGDAADLLDGVLRGARALGVRPDPLVRRTRHFLGELAHVDAAFDALERADLEAFSAAVERSVELGDELLGNQVPETLALAAAALELGAAAASPFGAGFGGSVWALIRTSDAGDFLAGWRARYTTAFGRPSGAAFFTTPAAGPASAATLSPQVPR